MKKIFLLSGLLVCLLFSEKLFSQVVQPENDEEEEIEIPLQKIFTKFKKSEGLFFTVRIVESEKPLNMDYFIDVVEPEIMVDIQSNKKLAYLVGTFRFYESASIFRKEMMRLGFQYATTLAYNDGMKISLEEGIGIEEKSYTKRKSEPDTIVTINKDSLPITEKKNIILQKGTGSGNTVEYRLQILASKVPVSPSDPIYTKFSEVISQHGEDGLYHYFIGIYKSMEDAVNYRNKIFNQQGTDVLIVPYHNNKKITFKEALDISSENK